MRTPRMETGQIIGTCLIFYNEDDEESHWDISYNLGKQYWGKGFVTEAMKEVMHFAERTWDEGVRYIIRQGKSRLGQCAA